jgi:hypothetical protein
MIAGSFTSFNGIDAGRIIRLNSDGLRDATFNAGSGFTSSIVYATAQQADGKIIVVGVLQSIIQQPNRVVRL